MRDTSSIIRRLDGIEHLARQDVEMTPPHRTRSIETAVTYLRVSSERQTHTAIDIDRDGNSLATQREAVIAKAETLGIPIAKEFIDPGASATSMEKRKGLQAMLRYIEEHPEVSSVIIYVRSRAFRNAHDALVTKQMLLQRGVRVVSAKEDFGQGFMGDAMETIQDVFNELQSRQSGQDIANKMRHKAEQGGTIGRAKIGYLNVRKEFDGRLVNTIDLDPVRAPLMKWAFERYASNEVSISDLAGELAELGLTSRPSPKRRGTPLSDSALAVALRDPYYVGAVRFKGELYEGRHEPLIDKELFLRVQDILQERARRGQRDRVHHHFLKGRLFCGRCSAQGRTSRMIFTEITRKANVYEYYFCMGRQAGTCDVPHLPAHEVEQSLAKTFSSIRVDSAYAAQLSGQVSVAVSKSNEIEAERRKALRRQLATAKSREGRLLDLAADGELDSSLIKERLAKVKIERAAIVDQLERTDDQLARGARNLKSALEMLTAPADLYARANENTKRLLLEAFFERLEVDMEENVTIGTRPSTIIEKIQDLDRGSALEAEQEDECADKRKSPRPKTGALSSVFLSQDPKVVVSSKTYLVAGAGFEPTTSGL